MNSLIFFGLIAVCAARPQAFLADTADVIAEKQRFFDLYNAASAAAAAAPDIDIHFTPDQGRTGATHRFAPQSHSAPKPNFASQTNFASQANFAPLTQWTPQTQWTPHNQLTQQSNFAPQNTQAETTLKYTGPLASTIPAGVDGSITPVGNTAEVEAAIAEFTRAYNAAVVSTTGGLQNSAFVQQPQRFRSAAPVQQPQHFRSATQVQQNQHHRPTASETSFKYVGPFASEIPAGLPGSPAQVAETPDVQAAKASFDRLYQQQLSFTQSAPQSHHFG